MKILCWDNVNIYISQQDWKFIVSPLDLNNVAVGLLNTSLKTHKIKKNQLVISTLTQLRFPKQWSLYTTTDPLIWPFSCLLWSALTRKLWMLICTALEHSSASPYSLPGKALMQSQELLSREHQVILSDRAGNSF